MKRLLLLAVLAVVACGRKSDDGKADAGAVTPDDQSTADGRAKGDDDGVEVAPPKESSYIDLADVKVGTCGATRPDADFVSEFGETDCDEPHAMELAGRYELEDDGDYPGNSELIMSSYKGCQPIFEKYVGKAFWDSEYDVRAVTPSPATWADGDREVVCFVVGKARGPLLEKAQRSKR